MQWVRILCIVLAPPTGVLCVAAQKAEDRRFTHTRGAWSNHTVALFNTWGALDSNPGRKARFASPDGKNAFLVRGRTVKLRVGDREYPAKYAERNSAELGWAPDSKHFFITWTETGELGSWHTDVYEIGPDGPSELKGITDEAKKDFERRIRALPIPSKFRKSAEGRQYYTGTTQYCEANVVGSQWLNDSHELLLSLLVPNVGDCRYMSNFDVYRVAVPTGKILEVYKAREAHRIFGDGSLPKVAE